MNGQELLEKLIELKELGIKLEEHEIYFKENPNADRNYIDFVVKAEEVEDYKKIYLMEEIETPEDWDEDED